ncbi:DUF560 domain-containing protein [Pelistega sp. NLN82]|uniref:DUF560 domain-containing protein n=1 Tax=Pelistega ratti TaxID=2652177 RepID=A0A6L9Y3K2_9BURK|nr:surface lipoprotein assembly modifier [Pelistega ratti]NEN74715.1 DUF560 domain-containing protein [Pelistega ratti]
MKKNLPIVLLGLCSTAAYAIDDTKTFLLTDVYFQQETKEHTPWQAITPQGDYQGYIEIDGQRYQVDNDKESLELAIYYAINQQQWDKLAEFVAAYRQLPDYQVSLALMAEGLIARQQGHTTSAVSLLEEAKKHNPYDSRLLLELGRVYAEDYQTNAARASFTQVLQTPAIPDATKQRIGSFIQYLDDRQKWKGVVSLGYGYQNNINQANGYTSCAFYFMNTCLIEQQLEKPVGSTFIQYQAALSKIIELKGHHKLEIRPLLYGTQYRHKTSGAIRNYSDNMINLSIGYRYQNAQTSFTLAPTIERYYQDGQTQYWSKGLSVGLEQSLTPRLLLYLQVEGKRFSSKNKQYYSDYTQYSSSTGVSYGVTPSTSAYIGYDYDRKKYAESAASSINHSLRLGLFKSFENETYINVMGIYRDSRYGGKTFLSPTPRHDKQKILIAAVGFPQWNIYNIYPELKFKRVINDSNIIFYPYKQSEVSLNMKYIF